MINKRKEMEDKYFNSSIESGVDHYFSSEEEIDEHEEKLKEQPAVDELENELEEHER